MTADTVYLMRRQEPQTRFQDLDRVRVTKAVSTDDGDQIVAGREGTVVGIWRDGAAYEVEFAHPPGALATVDSDDLALVAHAAT